MIGKYSQCDIAIVGGGLAGGLTALAITRANPALSLRLIEGGEALGGNHRWSWFASDCDAAGTALMDAFEHTRWDDGYEVAFPARSRCLPTPYRSLASHDFAAGLKRLLPEGSILTSSPVETLDAGGVTLTNGERIEARHVIDARGFSGTDRLYGGWQVFMGRHLRNDSPHGLTRPIIMDATITQHDGYRFVYVLPLSATELFIEDTYYNDSPDLDEAALADRISAYCAAKGWTGTVVHEETGVLPVITGGDFARWQADIAIPGVTRIGARGGFVHPLTSYTLPFAVETALAIARRLTDERSGALKPANLAQQIEARAAAHWRATGYYRLLADMLFGAAKPNQRFRVFQRFYGLNAGLIERFYAAQSILADKARVLCGKPPVPIMAALGAIASRRPALTFSGRPAVPQGQPALSASAKDAASHQTHSDSAAPTSA